ncbi:hypothetical protein Poli38472_004488 [Pythium oligandrum]|uniref:Uncharacterized protein n=1 Tax=Pythium oligandrum TaxID=41045 RepID=A0A8K1CAF0_PYTOL|nr:hypothetical protein Poli38472_004488 [Pythium oligandrum]|eukprot:TMW59419.1 hypothetical protein Poli38472_004488 [Pythium oligandrum]
MASVSAQLKWLTRLKDEEEESSSDSEASDSSVSSDGRDEALAAKRRATAATGRETAAVVKRTSSASKKTGEDESDEAMRAEQLVYVRSERLQVAAAMKASKEVGNGVLAEGDGGKKRGKAEKPAPEKKRKRPTAAEKKKKDEAVRRVSLEQAEAVEDEPASAEKPRRRPREAKVEVSVVKTAEDAVVANGDAHVDEEKKHRKTAKSRRRASEDTAAATKAVEATNGKVQHPHLDEEKKPKKTEKPRRRPSEDASVVRAVDVANGNAEPSRVEDVKKLKKVERKKASRGDVEPATKTKEMVSKKVLAKRKNLISDSSEGESDGEANGERVRKQSTEEAEVAPRKRLKRPLPSKAVKIEDPAESSANVKKEVVVKRPGTKTKINKIESKPARDALNGHPMKKLKRPIEKQVASLDDFLKEEEVKKSKKCSLKSSENGDAKENDDFKPEKGEDVLDGPTSAEASPLPTNDVTQPDPKFVQVAGVDPESAVVEGVAGTSSAQKNENGPDDVRSSGTIPTTSVAVNRRVEALRKVSVAEESEEGAVSEDESATQETKPQKYDAEVAETNGSGKPVDPTSFIIPKKRGGEKQITSSSQPTASLHDRRGAPQLNGVKPGPMLAPSPSPAPDGGYDVSFPDPAQQHRKPRTKNPVPPSMPPLTQSERDFMRLAKKANSIFKACSLTASGIGASGVKPHLVSAFGSTTQRYGVLDSSGSLYQEQTTMMKCVTRKAMKKAQHPPSFYGQLMEPPPCAKPSGDAEQTAEVQEARDSPSLHENAQASADQQSGQIPCYEKLEFERAQDRDWYQCRLYGTYFVPQLLRGRTTLVMLNAKYVRKSTGILFNSNRDKEDFAASISKRYTVNRTVPRCDIPQKNWQQLVNGHVTFLFLHYQNREDAASARRRFVDDLGRPLQLKGDKSGFDVGRAPMRSPTPPNAPAPRRSRSSKQEQERSNF